MTTHCCSARGWRLYDQASWTPPPHRLKHVGQTPPAGKASIGQYPHSILVPRGFRICEDAPGLILFRQHVQFGQRCKGMTAPSAQESPQFLQAGGAATLGKHHHLDHRLRVWSCLKSITGTSSSVSGSERQSVPSGQRHSEWASRESVRDTCRRPLWNGCCCVCRSSTACIAAATPPGFQASVFWHHMQRAAARRGTESVVGGRRTSRKRVGHRGWRASRARASMGREARPAVRTNLCCPLIAHGA
jgi:hypothetical protein